MTPTPKHGTPDGDASLAIQKLARAIYRKEALYRAAVDLERFGRCLADLLCSVGHLRETWANAHAIS